MYRRLIISLSAAGALIGIVTMPGCRASEPLAPRTLRVAWSPSTERQAAAVQAMIDGRKIVSPAPVAFVDGKRYTNREPAGPFTIINPNRVASVRLLRGTDATAVAGAAGRNGVIWITTKEAAALRH